MIEVHNLSVHFPHVKALKEVSLEIYDHEKVGFIGANGSGKSTLMKTLVGIHRPTNGHTTIDGLDSWQHRDRIWTMVELLNLDERLPDAYNTYENMQLFSPHLSWPDIKRRADELLSPSVLDLRERDRHRPLAHLSTGTRQKATIAALRDLPYLILDEPTMGFDPNTNYRFRNYVLGLRKTTIWITHNMLDAEKMNRVFVIRYGELVGWGAPDTLMEWTGGRDLEDVYRILTATDASPIECRSAMVIAGRGVERGTCVVRGLRVDPGQAVLVGKLRLSAVAGPGDTPVVEISAEDREGVALDGQGPVPRAIATLRRREG
jgi:ABC-type multidrug transport system ATPase subunit